MLSAYRCRALVQADDEVRWFSGFHGQRLVLGDPGARDAFMHILQGCVPHRRVLPVGVEAIRIHRRPHGPLTVRARERRHGDSTYVFDLTVDDGGGETYEEWTGLTLRDVGTPIHWDAWPPELLAPYLARMMHSCVDESTLDAVVTRRDGENTSLSSVDLLRGGDSVGKNSVMRAEHTPEGRIVIPDGAASSSHLDGHVLVTVAGKPVAADWEATGQANGWPLGDDGARLANAIADQTGEPPEIAAARVWTCREVLSKLGNGPGSPLTLEATQGGVIRTGSTGGHPRREDRSPDREWLLLHSGDTVLASVVVPVSGMTDLARRQR